MGPDFRDSEGVFRVFSPDLEKDIRPSSPRVAPRA